MLERSLVIALLGAGSSPFRESCGARMDTHTPIDIQYQVIAMALYETGHKQAADLMLDNAYEYGYLEKHEIDHMKAQAQKIASEGK